MRESYLLDRAQHGMAGVLDLLPARNAQASAIRRQESRVQKKGGSYAARGIFAAYFE
jgi:hypothetical protein